MVGGTAVQPPDTIPVYGLYNRFTHLCTSVDVTDNKTNDLFDNKSLIFTMNDIFHREDERLKTFENWPLDWLDKQQLARTGMFFTGDADKVKCYFCEVEIGRWERQDQPISEHSRWSPNCPLLRRRTTNNVPIDAEELHRVLPPISYDICGANDAIEMNSHGYAEAPIATMRMPNCTVTSNASGCSTNVNSTTTYFPEYPEYAIEAARVRSFAEWPRHMKQTPTQMAEAGFFYSGVGDRVKCFSCGCGLKDWDDTDEPWEQHALWLPKCRFVKLMKGQSFIDMVMTKHKAMNGEEQEKCNSNEQSPPSSPTTTTAATASLASVIGGAAPLASTVTTNANTQTTSNSSKVLAPAATSTCAQQQLAAEAAAGAATTASISEPTAFIMCDKLVLSNTAEKRTPALSSNIPEEKLCKICYANEYNTAFLPCGHVVACAKCASSVTKCPMCRKSFTDVMRVYFS